MGLTHKMDTTQFYVDYNFKGVWPICKCGCGEKVKWAWQLKSFRDYCQGHQARVSNNWGHNPAAIEKSAKTRRQQYASGERIQWNKGLTTDDPRVKKNGDAVSEAFDDDRKDKYAIIMKENRLDGTVPTLYGQDHPNWKGGVSEINILARTDKRLYDDWKYPILIRDGFKCVECGGNDGGRLHIHHDKEQMCEIVKKHMPDTDIITDFELKKSIASKIVDYHINNHVSGITLCGRCHNKIHPSLNFG